MYIYIYSPRLMCYFVGVMLLRDTFVYSLVGCGSFMGQDFLSCLHHSCFREKCEYNLYMKSPLNAVVREKSAGALWLF